MRGKMRLRRGKKKTVGCDKEERKTNQKREKIETRSE